jgi:predicted GIY-YIG superfamily endonuclease
MGFIYRLQCKDPNTNDENYWYIGSSFKPPEARIQEHFEGGGAKFTKRYPPISWEILRNDPSDGRPARLKREHAITLEHIKQHGFRRVRGGDFVNMRPTCHTLCELLWFLSPLKDELLAGQLGVWD